jgi:hypothetical protein
VLLMGAVAPMCAQPDTTGAVRDTLTPATTPVVDIRGRRTGFDSPHSNGTLTPTLGTATLAERLNRSPGLYLRDYGGHGGLQSVSLRGYSPNQTTLTLNGVPFSSATTGTVDFSTFTALPGSNLAITPGGGPLSVPMLAGNVNVQTAGFAQHRPQVRLLTGGGSFGERQGAVQVQLPQGGIGRADSAHRGLSPPAVRIGGEWLSSREDYPFDFADVQGHRTNAQYRNLGVELGLRHTWPTPAHTIPETGARHLERVLEYNGWYWNRQQNVPGPVVLGNVNPRLEFIERSTGFQYARFSRRVLHRAPALQHSDTALNHHPPDNPHEKNSLELTLRHQLEVLDYQNQSLFGAGGNSQLHDVLASVARATNLSSRARLQWLLQGSWAQLRGENLQFTDDNRSAATRLEALAAVAFARQLWGNGLADVSLRVGYISPFGWMPQATASVQNRHYWALRQPDSLPHTPGYAPKPALRVAYRLSANTGRRVPSFNELYFFNYGNPNLLPETVAGAEASFTVGGARQHRLAGGSPSYTYEDTPTHLTLTAFANQTLDKIIALPVTPVATQATQLGRATAWGFIVESQWFNRLHLNYTFTDARDRSLQPGAILPYTPQHIGNAYAEAPIRLLRKRLEIWPRAGASWVSSRFSSLLNDRLSYLPPYRVLDAGLTLRWRHGQAHWHLPSLHLNCLNVLNTSYAVLQNYPMPTQRWRVSFTWPSQ